jgi:hypothetical protein
MKNLKSYNIFVTESIRDLMKGKSKEEMMDAPGRNDAIFKRSKKSIGGTFLCGYVDVSYDDLVKLFGEPEICAFGGDPIFDDEDEIVDNIEWDLIDDLGHVTSVYALDLYEYNFTKNNIGEINYKFHIGANDKSIADDLIKFINLNI